MFKTTEQMGLSQIEADEIVERLWLEEQARAGKDCHDCGVSPGKAHLTNCDVARCLKCGGQRLSCDCNDNDGEGDIWTGMWPGIKECYETKLICYDTSSGWCFDLNSWVVKKVRGI